MLPHIVFAFDFLTHFLGYLLVIEDAVDKLRVLLQFVLQVFFLLGP